MVPIVGVVPAAMLKKLSNPSWLYRPVSAVLFLKSMSRTKPSGALIRNSTTIV